MIKKFFVFLLGLLSTVYLLNPGMGWIELLPDNIPILGNIDEAGATALLLWCLRYFGFDLLALFRHARKADAPKPPGDPVIDVEGRRVP